MNRIHFNIFTFLNRGISKISLREYVFPFILLIALTSGTEIFGATVTTAGSGLWSSTTPNAPWPSGIIPSAGDDIIIGNGFTLTVDGNRTCNSVSFAGTTASTLSISSGVTLTVSGTSGDVNIAPTVVQSTIAHTISGSGTLSCTSLTRNPNTGAATMNTFTWNISVNTLIVSGNITVSANTKETNIVNISSANFSTGGSISPNSKGSGSMGDVTITITSTTVNYTGGAQTVTTQVATYTNLTLSGNGGKTFPTGTTTVNGILSVENAANANTFTGTLTYGANATLQYNTTTGRTAGAEWQSPFAATGGVIIASTGLITMNSAKTFNAGVPLIINNGATLNSLTFSNTFSATSVVTISGTFQTSNTTGFSGAAGTAVSSANAPTITLGGTSIIEYTVLTGGQTITGRTYDNLKIDNTSATNTANGAITVNGTFTTAAGGTLNMLTNALSVSTVAHSGILNTQNTSATPLTTGKTWGGTVNYNAAAGAQTIVSGTYATLTLGNTSGIQTAAGNLTVTTLNHNTNTADILNMMTFTLAVTTVTNTGTIRTQNTSATPLSTGLTWGGTVNYDAATGGQTIVAGTYGTLTLGNTSGTQTAAGNLTVTTLNHNTNTADILNMGTFTLAVTTVTNTGTIKTQNTSATPLSTGKTWGGTVSYNAATGGQTIMAGTYSTLTLGNTSGTQTAAGNLTVTTLNHNTNTADILNMGTFTLALTTVNNTGTIRTQNTSATPLSAGKTWGGLVQYDGAAQTGAVGTYNNLTIAGSLAKTFATTPTVNGILSMEGTATVIVTTGVVTYGANATLQYNTITGRTSTAEEWITPFAATGGVIIASTGVITMNAAKTFSTGAPLTINSGATLNTSASNFQLTFGGNFVNNGGTFSANASPILITGTATQSIAGFTTTGLVSITKTAGTATFQGNVSGSSLTINGAGSLNLGTGLTHSFSGTLTLTAGTLTIGASTLTLSGNSAPVVTSGNIDASNAGATIFFSNSSAITLPASLFTGAVNNLTINGTGGITSNSNLTVNGILSLSTNPSSSLGSLNMDGGSILTMGSNATTIGLGDVTGIVNRTSFIANTAYSFGNQFTTVTIAAGGTMPTSMSVSIGIGSAPSWNSSAVKRTYDISQTGGSNTTLTLSLHYLDGELNSNTESNLGIFDYHVSSLKTDQHGKANQSTTNNWVAISNRNITYFASPFNTHLWGLSNIVSSNFLWQGTASSDWNDANNWAGGLVPSDTSNVVIPDASTTLNDPAFPATGSVKTVSIQTGGILDGGSSILTVTGGSGAWINNGSTFNAGTSTVIFTNAGATMSDTTNFYNVTIATGAALTLESGNIMRIAGALTLAGTGILNASLLPNTIEYNGTGQTIINPNGLTPGYYNLILSGSGTKTLPGTALSVTGDFTTSGTLSVVAAANMAVTGNFNIGSGTTFAVGANTLTLNGPTIAGTPSNLVTTSSSGLVFGGSSTGVNIPSSVTALNNLTINNINNVTLNSSPTISGALTLTSGNLKIGTNTLTLAGDFSGSSSNTLSYNGASNLIISGSGSIGTLFFDQASSGTTNRLANFTYNRSSQTITLGNALEVTGTITPSNGTLATGGFLTLISNASGTARIASGSGSYITGNVTVQRFVPANARRWRFLASTISNATLEDWRGEMFVTGNNLPTANQSTTIGGSNWGFDATQTNAPSVYWYDETVTSGTSNNGWTDVKNTTGSLTNVSLTTGRGYRVFIRGDRSSTSRLDGTDSTQNAVTLDLQGPVNTGNMTMPVSFTSSGTIANDGWCLVGNSYPSQYDWDGFWNDGNSGFSGTNYANINPTAYIFDATSNSYKSYNAATHSGTLQGGIIPSGSAFFVVTTAASPSMTFVESHKIASAPLGLFKTSNNSNELNIKMIYDSITSDECIIKDLETSQLGYEKYDILKLGNPEVNISSYTMDSNYLTLNSMPFSKNVNDTVILNVKGKYSGNYLLEFSDVENIANGKPIFLLDDLLHTTTDLRNQKSYSFNINTGNSSSQGKDRFKIVFAAADHTGIETIISSPEISFSLYPNPANDFLYINTNGPSSLVDIAITDISGKNIQQLNNILCGKNDPAKLSVAELKGGIYFITLLNRKDSSGKTFRFIKL